jgi:hypothetical protein
MRGMNIVKRLLNKWHNSNGFKKLPCWLVNDRWRIRRIEKEGGEGGMYHSFSSSI